MISSYEFRSDENRKEQVPHTPGSLSCICKRTEYAKCPGKYIPWHWHKEFEITYLKKGRAEFRTADDRFVLPPGGAVFMNANALHEVQSVDSSDDAISYTLFFDADFLTGGYGNLYSQKYVEPVSACRKLSYLIFDPGTPPGIRMLGRTLDILELFANEPSGYEFEVRAELCRLWMDLFGATETVRNGTGRENMTDSERIKRMIGFIDDHYHEKLMLSDIAAAADIGSRECTRCFSRTLGVSPIEYLNRTRVRAAARMIRETGDPISLIAERCGFASDSYFGKLFREETGSTPRDYRKADF